MTRKTSSASGSFSAKARSGTVIYGLRALPATAVAAYVMVPSPAGSFSRRCSRSFARRVSSSACTALPARWKGIVWISQYSSKVVERLRHFDLDRRGVRVARGRERGAHALDRAFLDRRRVRRLLADRREAVDHRRVGGELLQAGALPGVAADETAGRQHALHLGEGLPAIRDEMDHQRGGHDIERAVGKRHRVGAGHLETEAREMLARIGDLLGRGIDAGKRGGCAALRDQLAERAGAAADIEPARVRGRAEPGEKFLADGAAPAPHEALVVVGGVEDGDVVGHARKCSGSCSRMKRSGMRGPGFRGAPSGRLDDCTVTLRPVPNRACAARPSLPRDNHARAP